MHQIGAGGVAPVDGGVSRSVGVVLVEEVENSVPEAQAVGVVQPVPWGGEMEARAVWIGDRRAGSPRQVCRGKVLGHRCQFPSVVVGLGVLEAALGVACSGRHCGGGPSGFERPWRGWSAVCLDAALRADEGHSTRTLPVMVGLFGVDRHGIKFDSLGESGWGMPVSRGVTGSCADPCAVGSGGTQDPTAASSAFHAGGGDAS